MEVSNQNSTLTQTKRKLEGQISTLQEEMEDYENEAKAADERAKRAQADVSPRRGVPDTEAPTGPCEKGSAT